MEKDIDVPQESQAPENSNFDEEFGLREIVDQFNVLKRMLNFITF